MGGGLEPVARSAQAHFSQEPPPLSSTARQWPSALLPHFPTALGTSLKMGSGSGRDLLPCTGQDLEPKPPWEKKKKCRSARSLHLRQEGLKWGCTPDSGAFLGLSSRGLPCGTNTPKQHPLCVQQGPPCRVSTVTHSLRFFCVAAPSLLPHFRLPRTRRRGGSAISRRLNNRGNRG